ncbi:YrhK family protein [Salinisphaera sp.]|uniref:YrhK family protein n=1 Tax=Salinisphaera sp. TaxID=1914330 RepID=UPI002D79C850|nr:YrhK family protein [Salinisphaera sp.]HET7315572.1 YrhK family protein [Salinisphaera sp.]
MAMNTERFRRLATDFEWVHQGIGLLGGLTFFVGSIFFLYQDPLQIVGVWLFILGSFGMLVGNLGSFLVKYESHKLNL